MRIVDTRFDSPPGRYIGQDRQVSHTQLQSSSSSFIKNNSQRLNKIIQSKERKPNTKTINTLEKTIMKFDSGREHVRRMIGIFLG